MSSPPAAPRPARLRAPRRRPLLIAAAVVVAVVVGVSIAAAIGTQVLWFRQLGYGGVYARETVARAVLFVIGAAVMGVPVAASMTIAHRTRPLYVPVGASAANLDRYRENLEPLRRVVTVLVPALLGVFTGAATSAKWKAVLLFWHRTSFGTTDPQFHHDIGFYVFTVPFLRLVVGVLTAVLVLAGLAGAGTHYLYGGLRLTGPGPRTSLAARVQLATTASLLVLAQGATYWLDRYASLTGSHTHFDGADYTDTHVRITARATLSVIAVLCAVLFAVTALPRRNGGWRVPFAGLALLVASVVVVGYLAPAVVQGLYVGPSEAKREAPYISKAITATRAAYGLDHVQVQRYDPSTSTRRGALGPYESTTSNIRIMDPALISPTFQQLQQNKSFYRFPSTLDVDRYTIDGEQQDAVLAVREVDESRLPGGSTSWVNRHTVYTHGYGVVAAAGNEQTSGGQPAFLEKGIPVSGELGSFQPRIYFGEHSPDYSIVGGTRGSGATEFDRPTDAGDGEKHTTYRGDGGPELSNPVVRAMYAVHLHDPNILLSSAVTSSSQILYRRSPRARVAAVAPYLTLDGDPYPAVVDHRVVWIVDGYTTTRDYPYSRSLDLNSATKDRLTSSSSGTVRSLPPSEVDYLRNSVKATVDAYSGKVTLYAWDTTDPILRAWQKVFPHTLQPASRMSPQLLAHVRYPEDLFKVQRKVLATYHVTDPTAFYHQDDFWQVPEDPTRKSSSDLQPPYYLTLQVPGTRRAHYSLTTSFIPGSGGTGNTRNVLTGFLSADADATSTRGRRGGYGTLRLLVLPTDAGIAGPGQAYNAFTSDPDVSSELNLLKRGGTQVEMGNLLTLPIGRGLLYVEPVYVKSSGSTSYPLLQRVLVSFGGKIGFAPTLDGALDEVFGGDSGASAGDAGSGATGDAGSSGGSGGSTGSGGTGSTPSATATPSTSPSATPSPSASASSSASASASAGPGSAALRSALADAQQAYSDGQAALARGDFATYGADQQRLHAALARAVAAEG